MQAKDQTQKKDKICRAAKTRAEQKAKYWAEIEAALRSGTAELFVDSAGGINSKETGEELPKRLAELIPAEILAESKRRIEEKKRQHLEEQKRFLLKEQKKENKINQYLDVDGFVLLAGENTAVIAEGPLRECRTALVSSGKLLKEPRDAYCGKGAYAIVHLNSAQKIEDGTYDTFTHYQDSVYELDLPDPAATTAR